MMPLYHDDISCSQQGGESNCDGSHSLQRPKIPIKHFQILTGVKTLRTYPKRRTIPYTNERQTREVICSLVNCGDCLHDKKGTHHDGNPTDEKKR